jgi:hypothetical protein
MGRRGQMTHAVLAERRAEERKRNGPGSLMAALEEAEVRSRGGVVSAAHPPHPPPSPRGSLPTAREAIVA